MQLRPPFVGKYAAFPSTRFRLLPLAAVFAREVPLCRSVLSRGRIARRKVMDVKHNDREIVSTIISHLLEAVGPDQGRLFRSLAECRWKEHTLEVAVTSPFALERL